MSLVYITLHNESIYDVDKPETDEMSKPPKYISKFRTKVAREYERPRVIDLEDGSKLLTDSKKSARLTMGHAETPIDPPCAFLRKNQGVRWRRVNDHVCVKSARMPPVPKFDYAKHKSDTKEEKTVRSPQNCPRGIYFRGHKHRADFVQKNVELWKKAPTKRPPPRYVDRPNGETHNLLNTGLLPQYMCSKRFGKVPCYLKIQKHKIGHTRNICKETYKEEAQTCRERYGVRKMEEEERQQILAGLRQNYTESMKAYQLLPLHTDTQPKRLRKAYMDKMLRQLEQDIQLLTNNEDIYVTTEN